jgi:hypothetical protein
MATVYATSEDTTAFKAQILGLTEQAYLQGWTDAAEALRLFASLDGLSDRPDIQAFLLGAADSLAANLDKSKMI